MDEIGTKKSRLRIFEFSKMNPNSQKIKYFLIFEVLNFEGIRVQYIVIYGIFKVNFLQLFWKEKRKNNFFVESWINYAPTND